jgi:hypothetical protein
MIMPSQKPTFSSALYAELKRWPWWLSSLAVHTVLLVLVFPIVMYTLMAPRWSDLPLRVTVAPSIPQPESATLKTYESPPVVLNESDLEHALRGEPLVVDHCEVDTDVVYEESIGHRSIGLGGIGGAPLQGPSTNAAIGIGGGAGGAFGGRGGHRNLRAFGGGVRTGGKSPG